MKKKMGADDWFFWLSRKWCLTRRRERIKKPGKKKKRRLLAKHTKKERTTTNGDRGNQTDRQKMMRVHKSAEKDEKWAKRGKGTEIRSICCSWLLLLLLGASTKQIQPERWIEGRDTITETRPKP